MYHALITQIKQLSPKHREELRQLYNRLLTEQPIPAAEFSALKAIFPYIIIENNHIVSAFGLDRRCCPHQLIINGKIRFSWCIWDAFFLAQAITETAEVKTCDPITGTEITIHWENQIWHSKGEFLCSFPIASNQSQCSLRSAFCRYVHLFESEEQGRIYQQTTGVEIVSWETLLERSKEMAVAITSTEAFTKSQEKVLKNLCC